MTYVHYIVDEQACGHSNSHKAKPKAPAGLSQALLCGFGKNPFLSFAELLTGPNFSCCRFIVLRSYALAGLRLLAECAYNPFT